jgi:hypothetical protein
MVSYLTICFRFFIDICCAKAIYTNINDKKADTYNMNSRMGKPLLVLKWLVTFILIFVFSSGFSTPADSLKSKIGAMPSVFYTPETRLGAGALIYSHFKFNKNDSILKKSNTQSYISYTINKQFAFSNDYQLWLKQNKFYLTGAVDYTKTPQFFYGIGNDTKENDRVNVSFDLIKIHSKNLMQVYKNIYSGIVFQYQQVYKHDVHLMSPSARELYGNMGYAAKGLGPILIIDNRNNPLNPSKGSYLEASYIDYKNIIDNENMFVSFTFDARKYHTFFKKLIWNGNAYFAFNKGAVPYRMLPQLGGARFLRGYYAGRFSDNNMFVLQQEFRMPIYKMIGMAAFGGVGEVAKTIPDFRKNELHYDYGVGLRIRVNKKENTNIRIDYGFTKDSQGLYIVFAEAF